MTFFNLNGSFPDKLFDRFSPFYYPPHQKQKMKKNDTLVPVVASKMCPMEVYYDHSTMVVFMTLWAICVN